MDLDTYLSLVCRASILDGIGMDFTVVERDAVGNLLHVMSRQFLVEVDVVYLLLQELRVSELRSQVTVVGEEEHTRRVTVETADRIDAFRTSVLHEIHHGLTLLRVVAGRHIVLRLVQEYVDLLLDVDQLVVEDDLIRAQHLRTQLCDNLAIDPDNTRLDEVVSFTTAANTGISQELVQANRLVRVDMVFLIFNALLHGVLSIRIVVGSAGAIAAGTLLVTATVVVATGTLLIAATVVIATLLARLIAAGALLVAATVVVTTLLAWLIASLLARLVATFFVATLIVAWAIAALRLVTTLLAWLIATLLTRLITSTWLVATLIVARTIATLLRAMVFTALQSAAETFGTETALATIASAAVVVVRLCHTDAWTLGACTGMKTFVCSTLFCVFSGITLTATLVLLGRLYVF